MSRMEPQLAPGSYLVGASPAATTAPFHDLERALADAVEAATGPDGAA
jgi:hypothetical protein